MEYSNAFKLKTNFFVEFVIVCIFLHTFGLFWWVIFEEFSLKMTQNDGKVPAKTIEELYKNHEFYVGLALAVKYDNHHSIWCENYKLLHSSTGIVEHIHWIKFYHQEEGVDKVESNWWTKSISWWFRLFERMDLVGWFTHK